MSVRHVPALALCVAATFLLAAPATAGLTDSIKKKVSDKTTQKAEKAVDDADKKVSGDKSSEGGDKAASGEEKTASGSSGAGSGKVSGVSTKFDFVPGDSVLFMDDFTQDELGEFPTRWKLSAGTFEVAELSGERWLRCTSSSGVVRMKVPARLPEFWTLEFDFYCVDLAGAIALTVDALMPDGSPAWESRFPYSGDKFEIHSGDIRAETPLEGIAVEGRHHVMYMARGTALKVYIDRQRVGSLPDVSGKGMPVEFTFALAAPGHPMITKVRFAEGCQPPKDMLDTGKLVTYGIRFETGSDVVMPESAPVLRQVSSWMEQHADAKLTITGHTDNVGTPASNLDLSKRRAASVAKVLSEQFGIPAERFATDGKGDTKPIASNAKPEGKAMNRRVEFAKQ